ncbi:hypothetical protein [Phenylobacterium sp.]|uniref:hypothetical protein n=1 Tax=Phenylobacterium sp. TaxID=1871053 RepID=UPI0025F23BAF|nr:hypothetical protein [Phenylobacterium sp.]MBX3484844.1 hypothetical protein [Phenylobacterium sp.]MCW5759823.1 hypothetical protein [Phenylobacterium sp.]
MPLQAAPDVSGFQLAPDLTGDDAEDSALLAEMARDAEAYIASHHWAPPIAQLFLGYGLGGVLALFLAHFSRPLPGGRDEWLWVAVGDLPPAYFVTDAAPTPGEALGVYCELMEDWADRVMAEEDLSEAFPVEVAPTREHAELLLGRVDFIRKKLIPLA